jgi:hypothetical protein
MFKQCCCIPQCKYTVLWWSTLWTRGRGNASSRKSIVISVIVILFFSYVFGSFKFWSGWNKYKSNSCSRSCRSRGIVDKQMVWKWFLFLKWKYNFNQTKNAIIYIFSMTLLCFYFQYINVLAQYIIISFLNISLLGNEPTETHTQTITLSYFLPQIRCITKGGAISKIMHSSL